MPYVPGAPGGRVEILFQDGQKVTQEIAVADAHPLGRRPFGRAQYVAKFRSLTEGILDPEEQARFLQAAERLPDLRPAELGELNLALPAAQLTCAVRDRRGIF